MRAQGREAPQGNATKQMIQGLQGPSLTYCNTEVPPARLEVNTALSSLRGPTP